MNKNIAVVGCGYWGKNLVRNFYELESLHSICDPDLNTAKNFSDLYGVPSLSFDEILSNSNIKGVVLAVPAPLHAPMAIKAMQSKKNVFVEKPIAMNLNESLSMKQAAEENKVELMVGHLLQYHPIFKKVKSYVRKNKLGSINYIYSNRLSFGKIRSEEDVMWSFAPHDISMILSLTNSEPLSVETKSHCFIQKNISDISTIYMNFKSGVKSHVSVSWTNPIKEQKLVVIGEKMSLVFDDTQPWNQKLSCYKHRIDFNDEKPILIKEDKEFINVQESEPLKEECRHFINVVNNNINSITNCDEGIRVLRVLTAASLSQRKNNIIYIDENKNLKENL